MVPGCVPFKIVSDSPTLHSRWLLFFKVMIISLWHLLQYHSIVRWTIQAQWAEPLVLSITLKFILSLVSQGLGLFKVILVQQRVCSWNCEKHPNAYIAIKWNLNLLITFSTTLTPLARVVSRNDASPSDGENKRLVCVRGDQYHDHTKDIRKRVD